MRKSAFYILIPALLLCFLAACDKASGDNGLSPNSGTGQGGSLARFTISGNYLYMVDSRKLYTYSLGNGANPVKSNEQNIDMDIETIYAYGEYLFIGSGSAMYIYSLGDPGYPTRQSMASHVRACDPVVANDSMAYVTVRSGSTCGGTTDALMVYDVRNVLGPILKKTVNLTNPYGLGMHNNLLFVCDGTAGLKVFDISVPTSPTLKKTLTSATYKDVIPTDDLLVCMVEGGMILYEYDNTGDTYLIEKSRINN